jgi:hypothetical protein
VATSCYAHHNTLRLVSWSTQSSNTKLTRSGNSSYLSRSPAKVGHFHHKLGMLVLLLKREVGSVQRSAIHPLRLQENSLQCVPVPGYCLIALTRAERPVACESV